MTQTEILLNKVIPTIENLPVQRVEVAHKPSALKFLVPVDGAVRTSHLDKGRVSIFRTFHLSFAEQAELDADAVEPGDGEKDGDTR